jgi:hypothetical protein
MISLGDEKLLPCRRNTELFKEFIDEVWVERQMVLDGNLSRKARTCAAALIRRPASLHGANPGME